MGSTNQPVWGVEGMRIRKRETALPATHLSSLRDTIGVAVVTCEGQAPFSGLLTGYAAVL